MPREPPPVSVYLGRNGASSQSTAPQHHELFAVEAKDAAKDALELVASRAEGFLDAWKDFALRKDILNTAIGIMIGTALNSLISSLVQDILTPLAYAAWYSQEDSLDSAYIILRHGASDNVTYASLLEAEADGAITLRYGRFISKSVEFLHVSLVCFVIFRLLRRAQRVADAAVRDVKQRL